jgi:class 3 adenylate cyclase/tetratricopeptide (TPR) repeat protein
VCGLSLATEQCAACGAPLAPDARFCADCGAAVAPAAEGELRQITAAFCDLVGSTALSTQLDPEEYGEVIRAYRGRVDEVLMRYGGRIDKYLGDGVLIEFGWPRAHDDDAERAVLAALAIIEELAQPEATRALEVRIGIHTGPVLVGEMGSETHRETTALGETMNRAARLEACAPPGAVVISDATLRLVRGIFVVEDLGAQDLPGIAEPVNAHRVLRRSGVRSKLAAAGDSLTPLVSRDEELGVMVERWERTCGGRGQTLLLLGDPGIGKSRLVYELRERLRDTAHSWLETRGSSYTQHSAFQPAIQLIEQALEVEPGDRDDERLAKLRAGLEAIGLSDPDALPVLAEVLSINAEDAPRVVMSPELARRRTIELLAKWVLALAELQPVVLLVEDLHWCDPSTLHLFEQLLVQGTSATLMLVGTARPELDVSWAGHPDLTMVELAPLDASETRDLLRLLSSSRVLPEEVLERVVDEADGIPLFAEEMGRMVLESGLLAEREGRLELIAPIDELDIPTTLQDSLMARLDRLSAAKRVAQRASAIGREFDYRLLEDVSGLEPDALVHGLRRLVEDDLIFQLGDPPDATYTFKHALIQDAAYRSLVRRSRRPLHRRIAEALERRGDDSPEILARHWEAADEPGEAVAQFRRAAEQAAGHSAHLEAVEHLRRAIDLISRLPDDPSHQALEVDLQLALGSSSMAIRGYADPDVGAAYDRARSLCAGLGRDIQVGYTLIGLAIFYFNSGQVAAGAKLATEALEIAEREDDDALALLAHVQIAVPSFWQGDFLAAHEHGEAAWALYDRDRHAQLAFRYGTDQGVSGLCMSGTGLTYLGLPDRGLERAQQAVALARELGHPFNLVFALAFEAGLRWSRGEYEEAIATADEAVGIAEEQGFSDFEGMAKMLRGASRAVGRGELAGLQDCLEGMQLAASTGRRGMAPAFMELVAACQRVAGQAKDALAVIDGALELAAQTEQYFWDPKLLCLRGELALEPGNRDLDQAEADFRRGAEIAATQGDKLSELRCLTGLARLQRERGDDEAPERLVRPAFAALSEGVTTSAATDAAELLAESFPAPSRLR